MNIKPLLVSTLLAACSLAQAATYSLTASADAGLRADQPATNTGSANQFILGFLNTNVELRGVLSFDLSALSLAPGEFVSSVTLGIATLQADNSVSLNTPVTVNLYKLTTAYVESQVTWNNATTSAAWSTPGGAFGSTILSSAEVNAEAAGGTVNTWASTAAFTSIVSSSIGGTVDFLLAMDRADVADLTRNVAYLRSRNGTSTVTYLPTLTITTSTIPEPSTYSLLAASCALGLVLLHRRRS